MTVGRVAGATDTGRRRRRNEDAYVVDPPLFAVADGVGGAQAGEVASGLAAAAAIEESAGGSSGEERVAELIQEANRRVHRAATQDSARSGMGTTMTVALVEHHWVAIGHVGDSRAYRLRAGTLEQLTEDHSLVAELMRSGNLSPEEARVHPQRNVVTRALGSDPDVDVDTFTVDARVDDVFLLCSDGLSSMVEDDQIQETLERHRSDLDTAVKTLIRQALKAGGEDNITVVCFEIVDGAPGETTEQIELDRTREQALPSGEDEDTLDELDGVPALGLPEGDTMVVTAEQVQAAQAQAEAGETPRQRRRRDRDERRGILAPALLIALVALIVVLVVWGLTR